MVIGRGGALAAALAAAVVTCAAAPVPQQGYRIGLFLPTAGEPGAEARPIAAAARLAVADANEAHAPRRFELVLARADGAWDTGARELVSTAYGSGATVLIGSVDGRRAHLAEQVVTRAAGRLLLLTLASERTLTEVKLPWVFRLVPDDEAQAVALLGAIRPTGRRIGVLTLRGDYDADALAERLMAGAPGAVLVPFADTERSRAEAVGTIRRERVDAIVLLAPPAAAARLLHVVAGLGVPMFGSSRLATAEFLGRAAPKAEGLVLLSPEPGPADPPTAAARAAFAARYQAAHGAAPSPVAAVAYDAVRAVAATMARHGTDARRLAPALRAGHHAGVSGPLRFDRTGNRIMAPVLLMVRRGVLVRVAPAGEAPARLPVASRE